MAAKKKAGIDDEALVTLLDGRIAQAVGFTDSKLSREVRRVWKFFDGQFPPAGGRGTSKYISSDVYDQVSSAHAQLVDVFTGPQDLVRFAPLGAKDADSARRTTEACYYTLHCKNPGYTIISDVILDGLMARYGCAKVWWEDSEGEDLEEYDEPLPESAVGELSEQADVTEVQHDEEPAGYHPMTGEAMLGGVQVKRKKPGYPRVETVPVHEILVSKRARDAEKAPLIAHRTLKSQAQLKEMGLTDDDIEEMQNQDELWDDGSDDQLFHPVDGEGSNAFMDDEVRRERRQLWVYECYARVDKDGDGEALWKIVKCGTHILSSEKIKWNPLTFFIALRRPHSFWGNNFASRIEHTQTSKTAIIRGILDHMITTVTPRHLVMRGTLQNPEELRDDRLGGLVNVNRIDGIAPLIQPPLNPFVFQTLQALDYSAENTTGISQLSKGLNKDAISAQNSAAMVEQLANAGQVRQKIVARNFAVTFLIPLYLKIAALIAENAPDMGYGYVSGNQAQTAPKEAFSVERDCVPELHLGYGEADAESKKYLGVHQLLTAQPQLSNMYGLPQQYHTLSKALRLQGIRDVDSYLADPATVPPPQPDPLHMAEVQLKQTEAQVKMAEVQMKQADAQIRLQELQIKQAELQLKIRAQADKEAFKTKELDIDQQKVDLAVYEGKAEVEAMQQAEGTAMFKAIAAPRG